VEDDIYPLAHHFVTDGWVSRVGTCPLCQHFSILVASREFWCNSHPTQVINGILMYYSNAAAATLG